jgi:L-amino acid N-acyltransferase YncA
MIEMMSERDWEKVRDIYLQGISTRNATFEQEAPSWEKWHAGHHQHSRFVWRAKGQVVGWAALSPYSSRAAYAGVAHVSLYVGSEFRGAGIGRALLQTLIHSSEQHGIWTLQAGIFPENAASIALHRKLGFREVGRRERIGKLDGRWRDTILLERRSKVVGID